MKPTEVKTITTIRRIYDLLKDNPMTIFNLTDIKDAVIVGDKSKTRKYIELLLYFNLIEKVYIKGHYYFKIKTISL